MGKTVLINLWICKLCNPRTFRKVYPNSTFQNFSAQFSLTSNDSINRNLFKWNCRLKHCVCACMAMAPLKRAQKYFRFPFATNSRREQSKRKLHYEYIASCCSCTIMDMLMWIMLYLCSTHGWSISLSWVSQFRQATPCSGQE